MSDRMITHYVGDDCEGGHVERIPRKQGKGQRDPKRTPEAKRETQRRRAQRRMKEG